MEYYKIVVYEFFVDLETDVDIVAAEKLWEWQNSEMGKWIFAHSVEQPEWHKYEAAHLFRVNILVSAKLSDKDRTFWQLKWGHNSRLNNAF